MSYLSMPLATSPGLANTRKAWPESTSGQLSTLDLMWNALVEPAPLDYVCYNTSQMWKVSGDCEEKLGRARTREIMRKVDKGRFNMEEDREVLKYLDNRKGAAIRRELAVATGKPLEENKANRQVVRMIEKMEKKKPEVGKRMEAKKEGRKLNDLRIVELDKDECPADPFGLKEDLQEEDRVSENLTLDLGPSAEAGYDKLVVKVDKSLSEMMKEGLTKLLMTFADVFSFGGKRLGKIRSISMGIETTGTPPCRNTPYRESPRQSRLIKESMATLKELGIIERASGPMAAPVVMILQNGKWRFCVDFRAVNSVTPLDKYPIPKPDTVFAALGGAEYFSTMDANKGYHQFKITKKDRYLTAFTTEQEGQWQYKRVPFGLQNAPAFFQRSMDSLLGRYRWEFCLAYIDDIVVWSKTWESRLDHISKVLSCFKSVGLTLDERKCHWGFHSVDLLGLRVSRLGLRTLEKKTEAISSLPFPKTVKELRQILGQFSYYRQFIPRFASIAEPLTSALKFADVIPPGDKTVKRLERKKFLAKAKDPSIDTVEKLSVKARMKRVGRLVVQQTPERTAALDELKRLLSNAPCLIYPDFTKEFFLYTDASKIGIGGTLQQEIEGKQRPILFISRALSPAEKNYSATEMECLGVYWCFTKLSHYVDGSSLTVVTDHHALQWLWNIKVTTNSRLYRWAMLLLPYQKKLKIVHRPGLAHSNVDPISRFPMKSYLSMSAVSADLTSKFPENYGNDENFGGWIEDLRREQSETPVRELGRVVPREEKSQSVALPGELGRSGTCEDSSDLQSVTPLAELGRDVASGVSYDLSEEGLLVRSEEGTRRICVPEGSKLDVMRVIHDELGHPGFKRAMGYAKTRYYWPGMHRDLKSYCRTCHQCQLVKTDTSKKPGKLMVIPAVAPFHTLCVDFVEGLPVARNGIDSLATITDKFSKAVRLVPCKKSDSGDTFAQRFFEKVYPAWGVPTVLISDRDRRFTSGFWSGLMRCAGTKLAMTTAYHPQGDGQSERTNRTVEAVLRILCLEGTGSWVTYLPHIELTHNCTVSSSTGFSPYELLYVSPPHVFGDKVIPWAGEIAEDAKIAADELTARRDLARKAMVRAQELQKRYYDSKHSDIVFLPGEWARLVFSGTLKRKLKLSPTGRLVKILEAVC